jgi:hypothetical protein
MTSNTSGSVGLGFGVGVGFALQGGGAAGRFLVPCAEATGAKRKMASTANANASHVGLLKLFRIIAEPCVMPSSVTATGLPT